MQYQRFTLTDAHNSPVFVNTNNVTRITQYGEGTNIYFNVTSITGNPDYIVVQEEIEHVASALSGIARR